MEYRESWDVATAQGYTNGSNGANGGNGANGSNGNGSNTKSSAAAEGERTFVASMGLYVFSKRLLIKLLKEDFGEAADFARDILPHIFSQGYGLRGHMHHGYWVDLGHSIKDFFEANLQIAQEENNFNLFDPSVCKGEINVQMSSLAAF